jgi:hypothetical protein
MARIALLFILTAMSACRPPQPPRTADGRVWKQLAGQCYRIPEWNLAPDHASAVFPFVRKTSPVARAVTLQFASAAIKEHIPDYELPRTVTGKPLDGESVLMFLPDAPNLAQIRVNQKLKQQETDNLNLWYAEGDWARRSIEPAPEAGLFRVFHIPGSHSWRIVTKMPDPTTRDTHLEPDFWIASCFQYEGSTLISCFTDMERDGVFMELHTAEANLPYREQLARFFLSALAGWEVPCN